MLFHILAFIISVIVSCIITWYARDWFYKVYRIFTKNEKTIISIDSNGIPYVDYGYRDNIKIGIQRNPVTVRNHAIKLYHDYISTGKENIRCLFMNNANWILNNTIHKKEMSTLEYYFPLPVYNLKPPWRSAMANGQALEVLCLADELTNDLRYLNTAKNILRSFFIDINNGGVTYKDSSNSWWYEEYVADNKDFKQSRVLNGMLFALIGIYKYYKYTDDNNAKIIFDNGIRNVVSNLFKYDNNGNSYYDLLQNPANKYHQIHIDLLNELYDITKQEIFKEFSNKWNDYIKNKPDKDKHIFYKTKKIIILNLLIFLLIFISLELSLYLL